MENIQNNLTATIIIYYMDASYQWQTMYKTKQTDILPQHKLFLCGYAVLNQTVWYSISLITVHRIGIELYTSLMTFRTFSTDYYSVVFDI